ncbi:MAG: IS200/IS605 family transposase [Bacteroidales bacterium]|nr:IS200/IS605 family transposase [Bacteroidales bacterium]HPI86656.1 IS200/IS605 family transposase [Bacteroidales bacterium]
MKPGNFTQVYVQLVFAVKYREALLTRDIRSTVFEYISGIITKMNHKSINVNGVSDHIHILLGLNPAVSISTTVHDIKRSSSLFINNEKLCKKRFSWQEGYGAFTYSKSHLNAVYHYINNQEKHHEKITFRKEYIKFLECYDINYDRRFLFDFLDGAE